MLGTDVTLLAPDGFTPISAVVDGAGQAAEGVYVSVAGQPNENLGATGQDVRQGLRRDAARRPGRPVLRVRRAVGGGAC